MFVYTPFNVRSNTRIESIVNTSEHIHKPLCIFCTHISSFCLYEQARLMTLIAYMLNDTPISAHHPETTQQTQQLLMCYHML